jgi:hypothetical protein
MGLREKDLKMPGSVAHMLLFKDVVSKIDNDKDCDDLVNMLKENINYGRLGSIGPDLPYYDGVLKTASSFLISKSDKPAPLEKWSGKLHTKSPNIFPLKMIEIAWRETDLEAEEWDEIAKKQWAFIIGFLTHMAADQMIHPYINKIAGPYYRNKENRSKHMECEVYQDVVLYNNKYKKSILDENFENWVNISAESGKTEPYFRIFLQKSFIEAHAVYPSDKEIENWVTGLLFTYTLAKWAGVPYKIADMDFQSNKENSEKYKEYWLSTKLTKSKSYEDYYNNAVELASIYVKAANKLYEINHIDFKDEHRQRFLKIVINADLSNPLDNNILEDAKKAYLEYYGR